MVQHPMSTSLYSPISNSFIQVDIVTFLPSLGISVTIISPTLKLCTLSIHLNNSKLVSPTVSIKIS